MPFIVVLLLFLLSIPLQAAGPIVQIAAMEPDPWPCPRPYPGQVNVPLRTSFFLQLAVKDGEAGDKINLNTLSVQVQKQGSAPVPVILPGRVFSSGSTGSISATGKGTGVSLSSWFVLPDALDPLTSYTVIVEAQSNKGVSLSGPAGMWSFKTEGLPSTHPLTYNLNLKDKPVVWKKGGFFSGICQTSVHPDLAPSYDLMLDASEKYLRAWSLQRTGVLTSTGRQPNWLGEIGDLNIERDLETRRISAMTPETAGVRLTVEDFFGHQQYGIPSNRSLSVDYKPGYEVLIADGLISTRTKVLEVDDANRTILVETFGPAASGWTIPYAGPFPTKEDAHRPGLFVAGGCFLQRFKPFGTPRYFWGRLDSDFDNVHLRLKRRLVPNFLECPGDIGRDGKGEYVPKSYAQLHQVVRDITAHLIDRYGEACYDFYWSVFNEPDLKGPVWRSTQGWFLMQTFYDYVTDGILRAFEDKGMDSSRVMVGGIELGAIFGTGRTSEFLGHCSPTTTTKNALPLNAAYMDPELNGKRSKRVEDLCRPGSGKGAPLDFFSIHAYNNAQMTAEKLIAVKRNALALDPAYYDRLIPTTYESAPDWAPPPDRAVRDSFLGNGYFSTWCADVSWRLLSQAAKDPRYAYGESIVTRWQFPIGNFAGLNEVIQMVDVLAEDGKTTRLPFYMPIFHFMTLLNSVEQGYYLLPLQQVGPHRVGGLAARGSKDLRVMLYSHSTLDAGSQSDAAFDIALTIGGLKSNYAKLDTYQIDRHHNSIYSFARQKADLFEAGSPKIITASEAEHARELSELKATRSEGLAVNDQTTTLQVPLLANGIHFLVISERETGSDSSWLSLD